MSKGALKQHDEKNVCPRDRQVMKGGTQGGREWSMVEERHTGRKQGRQGEEGGGR